MDCLKSNWYNYFDSQETFDKALCQRLLKKLKKAQTTQHIKRSGKYMSSGVMTSADETKLFRVIKTWTDCAELQRILVKKWEK